MGGSCCKAPEDGTPFTKEDLSEYEACTNLTKTEVIELWNKFNDASGGKGEGDPLQMRLTKEEVKTIDQLKNNPFTPRLVDIFSERGDEHLTFDEFVDLFSVFSSRAPKDEKIKVAFRMYDFDDNGFIDPVDLEMVIETMLKMADDDDKERLSEEERICIIQKVITEGDPSVTEEDQQKHGWQNVGQISCHEFERIMQRVPDFESKFYISF
jgi:Ca2+-binding EF-hand superfamily protein